MIRVLICDDQDIVREGLQLILETDADIEVIGSAADGVEAVEAVATLKPDLVLMDLKMPGLSGAEATRIIRERFPQVQVLVLTTMDGDSWVFDAIRGGAHGYLLKDTPRQQLIAAVKEAAAGQSPIDSKVAGKLLDHIAQGTIAPITQIAIDLSEREREILALMANGFTNTEIAGRLYLSEGTVRNYVSNVLTKLNVTDRTQAVVKALRFGLVSLSKNI
jgi:DNA-binding NarL/FixJ family response regulator